MTKASTKAKKPKTTKAKAPKDAEPDVTTPKAGAAPPEENADEEVTAPAEETPEQGTAEGGEPVDEIIPLTHLALKERPQIFRVQQLEFRRAKGYELLLDTYLRVVHVTKGGKGFCVPLENVRAMVMG